MPADRQRFEGLVEAMFAHDAVGRLMGAAPLLHILRTADDLIWRRHAAIPESLALRLAAALDAPRGRPSAWADGYARYVELAATIAPVTSIRAGPLFGFPDALAAGPGARVIEAGEAGLLAGTLDEWIPDLRAGALMAVTVADGTAVSVCASVRTSAAAHCAGVETAPAHRGRGHAAAAVAVWAAAVRATGAEPFYATTFDNLPSQKVASRLGLTLIGSEFSIWCAL